jgi:hypothetical protein
LEPLTAEDFAGLKSGKRAIFVYGEITYLDVFGKRRFTRYRYFTGGATGVRGVRLNGHEDGNEAT